MFQKKHQTKDTAFGDRCPLMDIVDTKGADQGANNDRDDFFGSKISNQRM